MYSLSSMQKYLFQFFIIIIIWICKTNLEILKIDIFEVEIRFQKAVVALKTY